MPILAKNSNLWIPSGKEEGRRISGQVTPFQPCSINELLLMGLKTTLSGNGKLHRCKYGVICPIARSTKNPIIPKHFLVLRICLFVQNNHNATLHFEIVFGDYKNWIGFQN
jgi:hypothetical protein